MGNVDQLITNFETYILNPFLLIVFSAGIFLFVWGLFEFMTNVNNPAERDRGKQHMLWGTFGMFLMVSVYGIISLIDNTFGLNISTQSANIQNINTPTYNFTNNP